MINSKIFVFDIETIPDLEAARLLLNLPQASDEEVLYYLAKYHFPKDDFIKPQSLSDDVTDIVPNSKQLISSHEVAAKSPKEVFFKALFHKVVAISFAEIDITNHHGTEEFTLKNIRSGGKVDSSEKDLLKGFFQYMENNLPRLVSFNGRAFDMGVLKYRAMKYAITSNIYQAGDKWNSYMSRYSPNWHCDLHEVLSDYYASGKVRLNDVCSIFNYPGKVDVDGSNVFDLYKMGKIEQIRDYCETDVLNTYLVYLNYALHIGIINLEHFAQAKQQIVDFLTDNQAKEHFAKFLSVWQKIGI